MRCPQGLHGLNPLVSVNAYTKITVPVALYGCELWHNMFSFEIVIVNKPQHGIVKDARSALFHPYNRSQSLQDVR